MSNAQSMPASETNGRRHVTASTQVGRIVHDPRGNAVWDWAIETTTLAQATVEELLSKLADPMPLALQIDVEHAVRWCGDPYNRSC